MDHINAFFEMVGGILLALNVRRLVADKHVAGVSVFPSLFYAAWGLWNMYYYPSLGQMASFVAGFLTTGANLVWCTLFFYYRAKQRQ